jgi:hypothetical protein
MSDPMHVYPDPGGTPRKYAPSNTNLAAGSIASGAAAVVTAAAGSGTATDLYSFLFQSAQTTATEVARSSFLGVHAASSKYVALFLFFSSLSVVLATINLVIGLRMKDRLQAFSGKVCQVCKTAGLLS